LFEGKSRASRGVPNLNVGTDVPLSFTAFGRVIKPPAMRVVVYSSLTEEAVWNLVKKHEKKGKKQNSWKIPNGQTG
jgi:hypothetical protein